MSLLPLVCKIFERIMHDEILADVDNFRSPYLFGYRKNHSAEQCLTIMIETWKKLLILSMLLEGFLLTFLRPLTV